MNEERIEQLLRGAKFENNEHKEALRGKLEKKGQEIRENIRGLQEIFADAQLVREMAAVERPEDARKWFSDHGVELSMSEIRELGQALTGADVKKVELELDELENVAGGKYGPQFINSSYVANLVRRVLDEGIFVPGGIGSVRDEGEETMKLSDSIKWGKVR